MGRGQPARIFHWGVDSVPHVHWLPIFCPSYLASKLCLHNKDIYIRITIGYNLFVLICARDTKLNRALCVCHFGLSEDILRLFAAAESFVAVGECPSPKVHCRWRVAESRTASMIADCVLGRSSKVWLVCDLQQGRGRLR